MPQLEQAIQELLDQLVVDGDERGLQVAVYQDGKLVVDAWAGVADINTGTRVTGDTLFPVFSVTKAMTATAIHLLAERDQLDYDQPICDIWPEFAANDKRGVTIRHAMNHTAGLAAMPANLNHQQLGDWTFMVKAIAKLHPVHAPGEHMAYHAMTYGWILGEILCRVDGRHFPDFIQQELNKPLGIEDLFVSTPDEVESRVAWLEEDVDEATPLPENLGQEAVPHWVQPLHKWMNRPDARRACIPASSGIMSARAIARHMAALLPCGVDGVTLLPSERIRLATERQYPAQPSENAMLMSLGYHIGGPGSFMGENPHAFGHGGHGGSLAYADPDCGLAFALTKNRFNDKGNQNKIAELVRSLVDVASA
ncbi:serine hydrolase domain-containing protein [Cerasicoccus arenae]|uniref:Esterase n=1 Tax=Cerasicoccus arenae TaxID=424488 RepID=A0A8J3DHG8_9BACT|nr:serine hydrolase domain-containing protein [Cerasicoccus arenae]MBK1857927.1 beta-lactamase family protein [Cerasicoccus arenae]GHC00705.1 esterase [Cerasicoccus arenae]